MFIALLRIQILLDIVDNDGAELSLSLLCHTQQLCSIRRKFHSLDRGSKFPSLQQLSRFDIPQPNGIIRSSRGEECGGWVDVDGPDGSYVTVVCSKAFSICAVPGTDNLILRDGEDYVSIG